MEMFNNTPDREVATSAFGNKHMDMRIPLKAATESMKNTNKAGSKILGFVESFKHKKDRISSGFKKKVK